MLLGSQFAGQRQLQFRAGKAIGELVVVGRYPERIGSNLGELRHIGVNPTLIPSAASFAPDKFVTQSRARQGRLLTFVPPDHYWAPMFGQRSSKKNQLLLLDCFPPVPKPEIK